MKKLTPPLKLSLAALETLAVIAYKQPVTAPEIMERAQDGIESRLPWVQFCESLPAEATGTDPKAAAYLATMLNHQR